MSMSMLRRALFLPALAAFLVACGAVTTTPPAPATILVLGQDQAGQTVQARVGDTIEVKLQEQFPVPGSALIWDVSTNAPSVLKPGQVTRDPTQRPLKGNVSYEADFSAAAAGQGQLLARGSRTCEAMLNCPQADFTITIVVS